MQLQCQQLCDQCLNETSGMIGRHLGELCVIHGCAAICLIGDRADDQKRYFIDRSNVGNRAALHLSTKTVEGVDQPVFLFLTRDELVTGQNQALVNGDIRVCLMAASDSQIVKLLVWCEYLSSAWNITRLIAKVRHVKVMLNYFSGNDDVANVDAGIQRPCGTCVYDHLYIKQID